jgi:hypothetical protein
MFGPTYLGKKRNPGAFVAKKWLVSARGPPLTPHETPKQFLFSPPRSPLVKRWIRLFAIRQCTEKSQAVKVVIGYSHKRKKTTKKRQD